MPEPAPQRAAIVTGGSSGIGRTCALGLAEDGYGVTVLARSGANLEEVAAIAAKREGWSLQTVSVDLRDEEASAEAVERHVQRFGRVDVLMCNAGAFEAGPIETQSPELFDAQVGIGLRSPHLIARMCLPWLKIAGAEHGKALLAVTASVLAQRGLPDVSVWSAVKAGLVGWAQAAHGELGPQGIQVTALCPGYTNTPMNAGSEEAVLIQPESILEAVRFLLRTDPQCMIPEIQFVRPGRWT